LKEVIAFFAAWITMMLGSIPQQDVFQRVQSSKTEKIAVWGSVLGGSLYFVFAFVPMFLAYSATLIDPEMVSELIDADHQMILPRLVIDRAPLFAQVMFFGALLSAIKSCASATLLAPSVTFTENLLRPMMPSMSDRKLLLSMRIVTFVFTVLVTLYAMYSKTSIFKMVENAYQITLVMAFIPLVCGLYWPRATNQGALVSIFLGVSTWLSLLIAGPEDPFIPAHLSGLLASAFGMVAGSLLPQAIPHDMNIHHSLRSGHHLHAAAQTHHVAEHPHHHRI
jgi:Na+/proline symporter